MNLDAAKSFLGPRWVLHESYSPEATPWHSAYAQVNVSLTFLRVRHRLRKERSFVGAVEQVRQRLRLATGIRRVA